MRNLLPKSIEKENLVKILIAILFSVLAIVGGLSNLAYVPLSEHSVIDITLVAVVFATLIGSYSVAIPLALVWSLVTHFNVDTDYSSWSFWSILLTREVFVISLIYVYQLFRRIYEYSPYNVYRAIIVGMIIKNVISIPFDIMYHKIDWIISRTQIYVIETALCLVFMSLLISHLRQIHILNGVRKRGENN